MDISRSSSIPDVDNLQEKDWVDLTEEDNLMDTISFDIGSQKTGSHVPSPISEHIHFYKWFCTLGLAKEIGLHQIKQNNYIQIQFGRIRDIEISEVFTRSRFNQIFWMLHLKKQTIQMPAISEPGKQFFGIH